MFQEDVVRLTELLELRCCICIFWVLVWMRFESQLVETRKKQVRQPNRSLCTCLYVVFTTSSDVP